MFKKILVGLLVLQLGSLRAMDVGWQAEYAVRRQLEAQVSKIISPDNNDLSDAEVEALIQLLEKKAAESRGVQQEAYQELLAEARAKQQARAAAGAEGLAALEAPTAQPAAVVATGCSSLLLGTPSNLDEVSAGFLHRSDLRRAAVEEICKTSREINREIYRKSTLCRHISTVEPEVIKILAAYKALCESLEPYKYAFSKEFDPNDGSWKVARVRALDALNVLMALKVPIKQVKSNLELDFFGGSKVLFKELNPEFNEYEAAEEAQQREEQERLRKQQQENAESLGRKLGELGSSQRKHAAEFERKLVQTHFFTTRILMVITVLCASVVAGLFVGYYHDKQRRADAAKPKPQPAK